MPEIISGDRESKIRDFARNKYPADFIMQQHTYDTQLESKNYMETITNSSAKAQAQRKYTNDYTMQKYTYDKLAY